MADAPRTSSPSPSFVYAALRVFDLSVGEMLWSRRTVFMTGGAYTERARAFAARRSHRILPKPLDLDELDAVLRDLLGSAAAREPQNGNGAQR